jgi:hypothetical protein
LPRIALVGGAPWMAVLAKILEDSLGRDTEVNLILYSPGRGVALLHSLFTDKTNLSNALKSARIVKRYSGKEVERARRRGIYIIEDEVISHSIRRVEQTLWRSQRVEQRVLGEPPQARPPLKVPEARAYIEFTLTLTPSAPLSRTFMRALRRTRGLVTRRVDLVIESGKVRGVRVPAGFLETEYTIVDEEFLMGKLGLQSLPKWLPLTRFSCMKLAGPPTEFMIASGRSVVDLSENSMLACTSIPARITDPEDAITSAAKLLSQYIEAEQYLVKRVFTSVNVSLPDRSPLLLAHDEWPDGLYAIVGCMGNCLSLVSGLADSVASAIKGEEDIYGEQRLRRRTALKEYLGMPYILP